MGIKGYKGLLGKPVFYRRLQWVQDIVNFRNEKYQEDIKHAINNKSDLYEIDKKYDTIDSALGDLDSLFDNVGDKMKRINT